MPLARRTDLGDSNYAGLEVDVCHDLQRCLRDTLDGGFDFLVAPLAHPRHRRPAPSARDPSAPQPAPFARSDLLLELHAVEFAGGGKTSPWIDADSASAPSRRDGEAALRQELMWAAHPSLHAVLLPTPSFSAANYARVVNQFLSALSSTALWVRVPVVPPEAEAAEARGDNETSESTTRRDPFEAWANFRALCEGHPQLGVCLDVGAALPTDEEIDRWRGRTRARGGHRAERVRRQLARLPGVAQKRHQAFVSRVRVAGTCRFPVRRGGPPRGRENERGTSSGRAGAVDEHTADARSGGGDAAPTPAETARMASDAVRARPENAHPARRQWEYMVYLFRKIEPTTEQELQEAGYRDYLQAPLQPLMDNLESATYETFEKDASKYIQYEEAVLACLADRVSDADAAAGRVTVLMVVGAGRGPLVRASRCARPSGAGVDFGCSRWRRTPTRSSRCSRWWSRRAGAIA